MADDRRQYVPALHRPGMYVGEQGDRTPEQWGSDAVEAYGPFRGMDTAPQDGTKIDLWVRFSDRIYRWADAQWMDEGKHNCHGPANWCSHEGFPLHAFVDVPTPVCWAPIPVPQGVWL